MKRENAFHTPGPWTLQISLEGVHVIGPKPSAIQGLREADARLISAAPDMLQVLQDLQESAAYWSEYDVPLGIVECINAAISKATGETT